MTGADEPAPIGTGECTRLEQNACFFAIHDLPINSGATGPEWAKNANIRRALALAIDRDTTVEAPGSAIICHPLYGYGPKGVNGDFRV